MLSGSCRVLQPDPTKGHGDHPGGGGLRYVRSSARRPPLQISTSSVDATPATDPKLRLRPPHGSTSLTPRIRQQYRNRGNPNPKQGLAEPDEAGAFRHRLVSGKSTEAPEQGAVIQRFGQLHVGQVVPDCDQQGSEQGQRRPGRFTLGGRRDILQVHFDRCPVDQCRELVQRRAAPGLSRSGQRQYFLADPKP